MRGDQPLDLAGRPVEARGHRRNLVAAFNGHAGDQRAGAEGIDAAAQPLETPRQVAHDRPGGDADGRRHEGEQDEEACLLGLEGRIETRREHAPARQIEHMELVVLFAAPPRQVGLTEVDRRAGRGEQRAISIEDGDIGTRARMQPAECGGEFVGPVLGREHGHSHAVAPAAPVGFRAGPEMGRERHGDRHRGKAAQNGEIDLPEQAQAHGLMPRPGCGRRHSRRHAR